VITNNVTEICNEARENIILRTIDPNEFILHLQDAQSSYEANSGRFYVPTRVSKSK